MDFILLILVFLVGFVVSFIGAITAGAGLVAVTSLIFLGFPPQLAVALNAFGGMGGTLMSSIKYHKHKKLDVPLFLKMVLPLCLGAVVGAYLLINIDENLLRTILGFVLIPFIYLVLVKKDLGVKKTKDKPTKKEETLGYLTIFFIGAWGALFGAGFGILMIFVLLLIFKKTFIESNALKLSLFFPMAALAVVIYYYNGILELVPALAIILGSVVGGYVGSHTALKAGNVWIRYITVVFLILASIKLLFFP